MLKMIKRQPNGSLADKIAGVLSAVPSQFNPDDDDIDNIAAKLADFQDFSDDDEVILSKFRKQNVDLLADVDKRYAGKRGSRKRLQSDSSAELSEEGSVDEEVYEKKSDEEEDDIVEQTKDEDQYEDDQDDSEKDSNESNEESASEESDNEGSAAASEDSDANFQHISDTNVPQQVSKGLSVRNQMNIWESLLEVRIQLQKSLLAANRMPQRACYKEMTKATDSDLNFKEKVKETKNNIENVLDKLLTLQNLMIKRYPETKKLGKKDTKKNGIEDGSNEDIPSDTEDELPQNESDSEEELMATSPKQRKLNDYEKDIADIHEKYKNYRNDTIEKWNTKTRLSVTKNSGQTHSVVNHIEHILTDKEKLRKRTQLKRSEYKILGQGDKEAERLNSEDNEEVKQVEEYNTEIFDDNDFYHQLLRELIEVKSSDITDPVQLGRQWIQLQNLRSKMKRKIDTRATKGRKIRYAVHTKLVNFMAPLDSQSWTDEAKTELYNSLFGGRGGACFARGGRPHIPYEGLVKSKMGVSSSGCVRISSVPYPFPFPPSPQTSTVPTLSQEELLCT